ncbi:MAG: recombinase family protein [Phormidesmis sp.]
MMINAVCSDAWSGRIQSHHQERLAIVYVRQSTLHQVLENQESTRLQYALVDRASALGWSSERVLVIDEDLGKSGAESQNRSGFQRLVTEVSLNHVGLVLGIEMSRLARSCKDWHQLLEVCALFNTLIADQDGVYDPSHYNDRLLLGLKGTMSEAELHLIKQRMSQGKLNKAKRGELHFDLPTGYVRQPSGEVTFDPDEQVQSVIHLLFRKFDEVGTLHGVLRYLVNNNIQLGIRLRGGLKKGELEWRRPTRSTLQGLFKNPIYAGVYAYGRRRISSHHPETGRVRLGQISLSPDEWHVFIPNQFPAYLSWERYERNILRMQENQACADRLGHPRRGAALLTGLLVCGQCGNRLGIRYAGDNYHSYICQRLTISYGAPACQSIPGKAIDQYISASVLSAIEPATLELSLRAISHLETERTELDNLWQQRLERADFEAKRAERHYQCVEPENRLVARRLARSWEEKLVEQKRLKEEYKRFSSQKSHRLSEDEMTLIRQLSQDLPALWHSDTTTNAQRKEIVRQVISRIVVQAEGLTEKVNVEIEWMGGHMTRSVCFRPIGKLCHLSYYPQLCDRIKALASEGYKAAAIAEQINQEGFQPAKRQKCFSTQSIQSLMRRIGVSTPRRATAKKPSLPADQWWLSDLANALDMPAVTLYGWIKKGWVQGRQETFANKRWMVYASPAEIVRLKQLQQQIKQGCWPPSAQVGCASTSNTTRKL